mgnify:CR=1 FL=1
MMNENEETHAGEEHLCAGTDACAMHHGEDHMIKQEPSSASSEILPEQISQKKKVLVSLVLLVIIGFAGLSVYVYKHSALDKNVQMITQKIPFPAIVVGRSLITYKQYYEERDALTKYFASRQDAEKPEGDQFNKLVESTLMNKAVVKILASNYGQVLDQSKVEAFYQNIIKTSSSEELFKKQLQDMFGWSSEEFKRRIVEDVVLAEQVSDYIQGSEGIQQPKRDLIESAKKRIASGEDFMKVADEVHIQAEVTIKSDLGLMKVSDFPAVWSDQVKNVEKGNVTEIIDLAQGYAFFKVVDKKGKEADEQIHLYVVTIPKLSLQQVVTDYLKQVKVRTLIKIS